MNKQLWEDKAKTFPRFVKDTNDTLEILDFFRDCGVDFSGKTILDIGCGNGRFALQLAFEAKHIYGSDISQNMLTYLNDDAKSLGLRNITTLHSDWDSFDLNTIEPIDIAFASLTPALNNKNGFKKALASYTQCFCYVGFGRARDSKLLKPIMQEHNIELALPIGLPDVLVWLKELGYPTPKHCYKVSNYTSTFNRNEAIENIAWNVRAHEATPDMDKISRYVDSKLVNGVITDTHEREIGLAFIPYQALDSKSMTES